MGNILEPCLHCEHIPTSENTEFEGEYAEPFCTECEECTLHITETNLAKFTDEVNDADEGMAQFYKMEARY